MITHRNLKYALKLAETGNYRRAADALHITHSALVRGIKALENYLEIRMFERGGGC
jgi:DNA-binding transcriptional LysR family regulator